MTVKLYLGEINHLSTSLALFLGGGGIWGGSVGGLRGRDGMKVEKKQFQCQELMHLFEFSYWKEGIKCIGVDVVRGRDKMDFAKMFKKYWGGKREKATGVKGSMLCNIYFTNVF